MSLNNQRIIQYRSGFVCLRENKRERERERKKSVARENFIEKLAVPISSAFQKKELMWSIHIFQIEYLRFRDAIQSEIHSVRFWR